MCKNMTEIQGIRALLTNLTDGSGASEVAVILPDEINGEGLGLARITVRLPYEVQRDECSNPQIEEVAFCCVVLQHVCHTQHHLLKVFYY